MVPGGNVLVVIVTGGLTIVSVSGSDAVRAGWVESVTVTVKLAVCAAVGVPEMVPAEVSTRPAGNAPAVIANEYGAVPPAGVSACV